MNLIGVFLSDLVFSGTIERFCVGSKRSDDKVWVKGRGPPESSPSSRGVWPDDPPPRRGIVSLTLLLFRVWNESEFVELRITACQYNWTTLADIEVNDDNNKLLFDRRIEISH